MRTSWLITAFAAVAAASPVAESYGSYEHCLTDRDAQKLVRAVVKIFTSNAPEDLVLKYYTPDYHQYSDSTSIILPPDVSVPLGEAFTKSRKQFIYQHTGFNENNPGYDVEDIIHTCDKIVFRWVSRTQVPTRGIEILETVYRGGSWKVQTDYTEFNNVGLLINYGYTPCDGTCTSPSAPKKIFA